MRRYRVYDKNNDEDLDCPWEIEAFDPSYAAEQYVETRWGEWDYADTVENIVVVDARSNEAKTFTVWVSTSPSASAKEHTQ